MLTRHAGEGAAVAIRGLGLDVDDSQPVVRCPWHKWEFRLTDGTCVTDPRFRVRAYETTVADGKVFLDAGG